MNAATARLGGGFFALAAIWVGVYWMWEPARSAGVSFAETPEVGQRGPDPMVREVGPAITTDPMEADLPPADGPAPAPQIVESPGGVIPPRFREYTIQRGDTFESIARRFFGTVREADAIAAANPFADPNRLHEGQVISVPADPGNIQGRVPEGAAPDLLDPEFVEYTVVKGDTLSEIAQHFYGSLRYADAIFNANGDTMRTKNDLRVGEVLRIPSRKSVLGEDN